MITVTIPVECKLNSENPANKLNIYFIFLIRQAASWKVQIWIAAPYQLGAGLRFRDTVHYDKVTGWSPDLVWQSLLDISS